MVKKKTLSITEIENGIKDLINNLTEKEFITNFLMLYDIPKTSITRAKAKFDKGEPFVIKNKLHYTETTGEVVSAIDAIEHKIQDQKSKPRYIIANDYIDIAALDTQTRDTFNIPLEELPSKADFFLAWNGIEKADYQSEHPADRKAAERFAKLYDVLAKDNPNSDEHSFNLFLIRVLFLLFAEDTGIMEKGVFTNTLKIRTNEDGSNFNEVIKDLFEVLNINESNRFGKFNWLKGFPYVNGKLFDERHTSLTFTNVSRKLLIEAGELLNWNEINPDILGSMIQSVASPENRHSSGMHYTSVPNIMKVIKPLFLDELNNEFEKLYMSYEKITDKNITNKTRQENKRSILKSLGKLHTRISNIKFLDPASGSGNFLIITYKEIRRLEIKIILLEQEIEQSGQIPMSSIRLSQFNGIEIDDFAHEVAKISLWIAEHQMNEEMVKAIPSSNPALLPLKDSGNIIRGNALHLDWNEIVPHKPDDEIYIMGNPPYLGAKLQSKQQKADLTFALDDKINSKKVDFIIGWFYKGAQFINNSNNKLAFVTTNSINQGEQVSLVWPELFKYIKISFAYTSFKWKNNAKSNAGVTVSIIGLESKHRKTLNYLYSEYGKQGAATINPYLTIAPNIIVSSRNKSVSGFPKAVFGSMPRDGGNLIFSEEEKNELFNKYTENTVLHEHMKYYVGSYEFINGIFRYTLWFESEAQYNKLSNIKEIENRINMVKKIRLESKASSTREAGKTPYQFVQSGERVKAFEEYRKNHNGSDTGIKQIIIPRVSSESREYVPMGYVNNNTVISDSAIVIYNAPIWLLGILESKMHMVWLRSIGGKLKTDYRYSAGLVYNTFPIQNLSTQRKNEIKRVMLDILDIREYEGGSLAELYNTKTMPKSLQQKHEELDGIIDRAYRQKPFDSDEERLSILLELYQNMTKGD
ncbi:class I SAM-dependent DNA methyltransferase [Staphylococcus cohnii]|uniref:DNA methyltransferase n=1 Tax=Staphylococcus TaxID=1279 RepID=UPI000D19D804|nr:MULTISPECIES: DNA methyltransferase [Staphylococcus]MCE5100588.1 class I SAM-dependent DNA methyltransferase [Staphylococcus cohnii]PTH52257.1 DNA methyltransferase [Staphylococcus arlettae]